MPAKNSKKRLLEGVSGTEIPNNVLPQAVMRSSQLGCSCISVLSFACIYAKAVGHLEHRVPVCGAELEPCFVWGGAGASAVLMYFHGKHECLHKNNCMCVS